MLFFIAYNICYLLPLPQYFEPEANEELDEVNEPEVEEVSQKDIEDLEKLDGATNEEDKFLEEKLGKK